MAFGSHLAATSQVVLEAVTGQFNRDISEAQAHYARTTAAMSDEALRMEVAQTKLNRAISRFGPESNQARQATLQLRSVQRGLREDVDRTEASLGRLSRGAIAGSGVFHGLGRAVAFASTSFLGGLGFVYALRKSIDASREAQVVRSQERATLTQLGLGYQQHAAYIEAVIQKQSKLTAFDDEQLIRTFTALVTRTGDVNEALRLNAVVADVARGRNIDLNTALTLVTRASIGQVGSLRRLGIDVKAVTSAQDRLRQSGEKVTFEQRKQAKALDEEATKRRVIALLQEKYGGRAAAFAKTDAGAQELFNKALADTEEAIGKGVLPALTKLLRQGTDYLDQLNKSGKLEKEVSQDAKLLGQAISGFAAVIRVAAHGFGLLSRATGGTKHAVELLTTAAIAWKLRGVIALVSGLTAVEGAAAGAAGGVNSLRFGLLALRALGPIAIPVLITYELTKDFGGHIDLTHATKTDIEAQLAAARKKGDDLRAEALQKALDAYDKAHPTGMATVPTPVTSGQGRLRRGGQPIPTPSIGGGAGTPAITDIPARLARDLARARVSKTQADDLHVLSEISAVLRQALRDKRLTVAQQTNLYNQLASVDQEIASIQDGAQRAHDQAGRKREEAAKRAERQREAEERRQAHQLAIIPGLSLARKLFQEAQGGHRLVAGTYRGVPYLKEKAITIADWKRVAGDLRKEIKIALRRKLALQRALHRARRQHHAGLADATAGELRHVTDILFELERDLGEALQSIKELGGQDQDTSGALAREFLDARASFFGQFAPNVFGRNDQGQLEPGSHQPMAGRSYLPATGSGGAAPHDLPLGSGPRGQGSNIRGAGATVVVHQHFQAPTTDRHREARYALIATRAAFDG
jgi:hypothetical protein